ncbi:MAG TPA: hypothetical protein VNO52_07890, partial [Methylomirabilota bacterium]|nr:hypothetical protein [Methylomirabilota bacterium]
MTLQRIVTVPGLLTALAFAVHGAPVPPPEQLLPADTLLVLAVPDCGKSRAEWRQSPASQLWNDPSMKAFTEKLWTKVKTDLIEPFEKSAGIKLADYSALAQGQVTFAVTQNGWDGVGEARPGLLLLVDAGSKADTLKTNLAMLRKKWVDSGKPLKTEKIREVEFTVLVASPDDLGKALGAALGSDTGTAKAPGGAEPADKSAGKLEWIVGQSDSLLIAGNSIKDIEKVLVRQSGGSVAHLAETASFAASFNAQLRGASAYVWVNAKPLIETVVKQLARGTGDDAGQPRGPLPGPDRIFAALGLTGLQTVAASVRDTAEGCHIEGRLTVPESARRGLFKLVAFEAKEAEPPPFVPVDAVKFNRWRLDLPKAFATLEAMIVEMSPQAAGVIKLLLDNAGKDKDPNFDLRKSLIGNLGDDVISYEKAPREQTLEAMGSQPNLILIASPRAQELAASIQALASFMPQRGTKNKEREFLGRKVYALGLPPAPVPGGGPPVERTLHYTASGGY